MSRHMDSVSDAAWPTEVARGKVRDKTPSVSKLETSDMWEEEI